MAHFDLTVCLPPTEPSQVVAALTAALAPFDVDLDPVVWNDRWEWDRWRIRACGERLLVKPAHVGDPRLVYEGLERGEVPPSPPPAVCDGGPRGLLDFERTRERAVATARADWEAQFADWQRAVADHPPARSWAWFHERHEADPVGYPLERARLEHQEQPLLQAMAHVSATSRYPSLGLWVLGSDPVAHFGRGAQGRLDDAAAWAVATWALLTLDGEWLDGDKALDAGDVSGLAHVARVAAYLDALDDDALMIQVICHC